jgi:2-keto-3-deoxy-6-phosphogluconate aldolase
VKQHGLKFVSTTSTDDLLLRHVMSDDTTAVGVSMLSGCETYEDCMRAIRQGVRLLKFYPSFKVPPNSLRDIVSRINSNENDNIHIGDDDDDDDGLRIFVAGSVKLSDLKSYLDAGDHASMYT